SAQYSLFPNRSRSETMGHRRQRLDQRDSDARAQKQINKVRKGKEHARRDVRMMDVIKSGSLPYTPDVMSWLSRELDKPSSKITADDIATLTS
ncbi:unnamed protein product, partial [marine sediment metagenome]